MLALLAAMLIFTPSPDPRAIRHECEAWHISIYAPTPWRQVACIPDGVVIEPGRTDWIFSIPEAPDGWFLAAHVRACSPVDCSEWMGD